VPVTDSQLFGRSALDNRIGSQVDVTHLVNVWSCLTRVIMHYDLIISQSHAHVDRSEPVCLDFTLTMCSLLYSLTS
jgi:hypothetical protein